MDTITKPHDVGYRWLLSSREIFLQLLRSFVKQPWVAEIDEASLKRTDKSFVTKDFREKEADLVYEANLRGKTVVFYILLELQRKVDFFIPYRLLTYMSGIWQNYLNLLPQKDHPGPQTFRLPSIVPMILYNGAPPWTAARSFREILDAEECFDSNLLDFEYILLDVNRYQDDALLQLSNTIGTTFLLDKSRDTDEFRLLWKRLAKALRNIPEQELNIFVRWLRYVIGPRLPADQQNRFEAEMAQIKDEEVRKMVFANLEKNLDAIEARGIAKGEAKGIVRGKEKTALAMLRDHMSVNSIAKYTDLPIERIHELAKKL